MAGRYLKNYLDQEGDRKKRNSRRDPIPPSLAAELSSPSAITSSDSADLIEAYVNKINQLQVSGVASYVNKIHQSPMVHAALYGTKRKEKKTKKKQPEVDNVASYIVSCPNHCFFSQPRSGELRAQILKSRMVRTQSLNLLPFKPAVGQYIAIHATLTARDFFLAYFYPSGPFLCFHD